MKKPHVFLKHLRTPVLAAAIFSLFMQCGEEEIIPVHRTRINPDSVATNTNHVTADCDECAYVVPEDTKVIDGKVLGIKPGDIIGLDASKKYGSLEFINLVGTTSEPIIIKNFGGTAKIVATDKWHAVRTEFSKHFRITGGSAPGEYGIDIQGGQMGLKMDGLSTNFEVDHVRISNVGFAGIMAKTDPSCDDATIRGNFTMYDVSLHDNYIHDTGGEGFYVGNSFWDGMERECGVRLPHEIKGLKIYNNRIENTGWDGIQVGCAIEGTEIYNNTVKNYGKINKEFQNNGIQIGGGTGGQLYNNFVKDGTGNGLIIMGTGDNVIHNNIIVNAGSNGVFCDERYTPGEGFKFINNTIISPKKDGIRVYAELVPMNTIVNNIIANPGSYGTYSNGRTNNDSYVYLSSADVRAKIDNNLFVHSPDEVKFIDRANDNYRLKANSPAINFGSDITRYKIKHDFYKSVRKNGFAYDVGASEF